MPLLLPKPPGLSTPVQPRWFDLCPLDFRLPCGESSVPERLGTCYVVVLLPGDSTSSSRRAYVETGTSFSYTHLVHLEERICNFEAVVVPIFFLLYLYCSRTVCLSCLTSISAISEILIMERSLLWCPTPRRSLTCQSPCISLFSRPHLYPFCSFLSSWLYSRRLRRWLLH